MRTFETSPACAALIGEPIANGRDVLDRYGFKLCAATLPGDGWRRQHDALKWLVSEDAKQLGIQTRPEVYGLFAACIPQAGRGRFDGLPVRKRQGLVPDLLMKLDWPGARRPLDQLLELKTLHHGSTT